MGYRPDLQSCWAKIGWAETHGTELKADLGSDSLDEPPVFRDKTHRVTLVGHYKSQTDDHYVVKVAGLPEKKLIEWGLLIGDAVHNLRTALDHLVWQLALEQSGGAVPNEAKSIQFPFATSKDKFENSPAARNIDLRYWTILKRFQPYRGRDGRLLRLLHDMDIGDKHKVLTPIALVPDELRPYEFVPGLHFRFRAGQPLKVGTEILSVVVNPGQRHDPELKAYSNLIPAIRLARGTHPVKLIDDMLFVVARCVDAVQKSL